MASGAVGYMMTDKWGNQLVEVPCAKCGTIKIQRRSAAKCGDNPLCRSCGGREGMRKRGRYGRKKHDQGYIMVMVHPDDPLRCMAQKSGWIMEHRLVMARHLGRPLELYETVHHKGIRYGGIENRSDNPIDNLELRIGNHGKGIVLLCAQCDLRKEIRLLKWQIKELQKQVHSRRGVYDD